MRVTISRQLSISLSLLLYFNAGVGLFAVSNAPGPISFNRDVRPILAENCFFCHGPDPGTRKAGLRLDTEAGLFEKRKDDPAPVIRGDASHGGLNTLVGTLAEEPVVQGYDLGETISVILAD